MAQHHPDQCQRGNAAHQLAAKIASLTPGDGDHLDKPSGPSFKPLALEKFSAPNHAENSAALKGKQLAFFTDNAAPCYIVGKSRGPVLENTKHAEVATPTVKRGFVMPKFFGLVRPLAPSFMVSGGMGISVRTAARLRACFQHPVHLLRLKTQLVESLIHAGTKSMTTSQTAIRTAAPSASTPDPIALHIKAMNCLSICRSLLTANEPMYLFALNHLAAAQQAIEALRTHELSQKG